MIFYIWLTIINLFILAGTIRFYRLNNRNLDMLDPTRQVFTIHTHKHPIVVQDETLFSTYHYSIIGDTFKRTHLRESAHRLIDKCMDEGLIEINESESNIPLTSKIKLKITLLK